MDSTTRGNARAFYTQAFFNVLSFSLLTGNIITLYALRFGAGNSLIGLLSSFLYVSFLFMIAGRPLIRRLGAVRLMGIFWLLRYLAMVPTLLVPLRGLRNTPAVALALITCGAFGFHACKGIALLGYAPIVGEMFPSRLRGIVLSRRQIIIQSVTIPVALLAAVALGQDAPVHVYSIFIALGIGAGLVSGSLLLRFPEPRRAAEGYSVSLAHSLRRSLRSRIARGLLIASFANATVTALLGPFVVVYLKQVLGTTDGGVMLMTAVGGMGAVVAAFATSLVIHRVGPRAVLVAASAALVVSVIPLVTGGPSAHAAVPALGVMTLLFLRIGAAGILNGGQVFLFSVTPPAERTDYGMFYNVARGIGGLLGSLCGGAVLDLLGAAGIGQGAAMRAYFLAVGVLALAATAYTATLRGGGRP